MPAAEITLANEDISKSVRLMLLTIHWYIVVTAAKLLRANIREASYDMDSYP